jgi:DNA primase
MAISDEDIAKVRDATDFVAIASEHLQLSRVGNRYKGLCPFHSEKSPSFTLNPEKGLYYCFGCQAKGDVIRFVMELDHLDFAAAVERLATKAGITIRYDNEATGRDRKRREELRDTMERAVEWYHQQLLSSPAGGAARHYLKSRGYDGDAVRTFKLGWAPDGWDTLNKTLSIPSAIAKDTGLGILNSHGRMNDFFRARILFPIFDVSGQPIAFGGRKLPEADGPKYKNSSETLLYSKSRTLYGLNWAKKGIVEANEVIVCEGYTDVIAFHRAGMARAVATCGTALADEHFKMLKNFARRIVLAYDADSAGQNAAAKFYEWEKRFEIDLVVVSLPDGADPADLARTDPAALAEAVKTARPFLAFRIERVITNGDLKTPEGRGRVFEQAVEMIAEHPSPFVREQYLREVADQCRISESMMAQVLSDLADPRKAAALRAKARSNGERVGPKGRARDETATSGRPTTKKHETGGERAVSNEEELPPDDPSLGAVVKRPARLQPSGGRAGSPKTAASAATTRIVRAEEQLLTALIHHPESVIAYCVEGIFASPLHAQACALLLEVGDVAPAIDRSSEEPELEHLLQRLAVEQPAPDGLDLVGLVVRGAVARAVNVLRRSPEHPQSGAIPFLRAHEMLLTEPETRLGALDQLVPWFLTWGTSTTEKD